jgi:hypothetical protein
MKLFSKLLFLLFGVLSVQSTEEIKPQQPLLEQQPPKEFDNYLSSISSELMGSLAKQAKTVPKEDSNIQQPNSPSNSDEKVTLTTSKSSIPNRKLDSYETLTNSYLQGDSDDTTTTNRLSMLIAQQRSMQNFRVVGTWLNDLEGQLDDLRDAVNRRVADLSTGLQRRNQLLGHYNYMGQGLGGAGLSRPMM